MKIDCRVSPCPGMPTTAGEAPSTSGPSQFPVVDKIEGMILRRGLSIIA
jgi:hypothetical protein